MAWTGMQEPCQRFARNRATHNLAPPHVPTLGTAFHMGGYVVTTGIAWGREPPAHRWHARGQGFNTPVRGQGGRLGRSRRPPLSGASRAVDEAVASPQLLSDDPLVARRLFDLVGSLPTPVWGRDELGAGEMWNSDSVIAWLLACSGLPADAIHPTAGGRPEDGRPASSPPSASRSTSGPGAVRVRSPRPSEGAGSGNSPISAQRSSSQHVPIPACGRR
jgi:hypothetical protein